MSRFREVKASQASSGTGVFCFYAVSTEDRTVNPDLERFMAKRMGAKTI
jgi:hypothetical protein